MIREATERDVPRLVEMGVHLFNSEYSGVMKANPQHMERTVRGLLKNGESGSVLVAEKREAVCGMLGFVVYPHFVSGEVVAGELFWWVEPEARGAGLLLLRRAEQKARELGAQRMQMIAPSERTAHLYERLGYQFVERAYQRAL